MSPRITAGGTTAPVGFEGEFRMTQRVRGAIAASSASGVGTNPSSRRVGTMTGVPPAIRTMSG